MGAAMSIMLVTHGLKACCYSRLQSDALCMGNMLGHRSAAYLAMELLMLERDILHLSTHPGRLQACIMAWWNCQKGLPPFCIMPHDDAGRHLWLQSPSKYLSGQGWVCRALSYVQDEFHRHQHGYCKS